MFISQKVSFLPSDLKKRLVYRGMLAIRMSVLLWLVVVKLSKAPETPIGGTPMTKHVPNAGEILPDSIHPLDQQSSQPVRATDTELYNDKYAALKRQHSFFGSSGKRQRSDREEVADYKHNDKSKNIEQPLSNERKLEIKRNLARYQEDLTAMKARGEQMKKWFTIVMQREDMLGSYGMVDGGKSIKFILKELNGVQRDINWVVQTQLFKWASLGQRTFIAVKQGEVSQKPQARAIITSDNLGINSEVQSLNQKSPAFLPSDLTKNIAFESGKEDTVFLEGDTVLRENLDSINKSEDFKEDLEPQLNENFLGIIYGYLMRAGFSKLCYILHTTTFQSWKNATWLRYWEEIRVIKLAFEKSLFHTITFLHKFKLVEEEQFKLLLSCDHILELIGDHLVDLFHVVQDFTYNELAFTPDFEFLRNHQKTDHLQDIFKVLKKSQQAHVLSSALASKVQIYQRFLVGTHAVEWSAILMEIILRERLFARLEAKTFGELVVSVSSSTEENDLKQLGKILVGLFQNPFPNFNHAGHTQLLEILQRIQAAYIIIFEIVNFIQKYHYGYLRSIFEEENQMDYEILKNQLKLFETGFELKRVLQQGKEYMEIIGLASEKTYTLSKANAKEKLENTKGEYHILAEKYRNIEKDFEDTLIIKNNQRAQNWFHSGYSIAKASIRKFHSAATSWDMGIELEEKRRESLRSNHKQNKKNEKFPNMNVGDGSTSSSTKHLNVLNKELMDLWDPIGIYV